MNNCLVWNLHEQLCVAALELGDYEMAQKSIEALQKQFPSSHRVSRLRGMLLEAQGKKHILLLLLRYIFCGWFRKFP